MPSSEQLSRLMAGFAALGARRLVLMGLVGLSVIAAVATAAVFPDDGMQPSYLSRQDCRGAPRRCGSRRLLEQ